jgi:hypothetical protein
MVTTRRGGFLTDTWKPQLSRTMGCFGDPAELGDPAEAGAAAGPVLSHPVDVITTAKMVAARQSRTRTGVVKWQ